MKIKIYKYLGRSSAILILLLICASCVSKKRFGELKYKYDNTVSTLAITEFERQKLEEKWLRVEDKVNGYNEKIISLKDLNDESLQLDKDARPISENAKKGMRRTLEQINSAEVAKAKTLKDSMNLAISYNLKKSLDNSFSPEEDIEINIDESVVMINVSDKLMFRSGSYAISSNAKSLLQRLADVINSEPAIEVMVEGHTDDATVKPGSYIKDNWELSVERSTAIIRELQDNYNVDPEKMIAAGRSSYLPIAPNDSAENRGKNRRTRILILPNLDKFLALLGTDE